MNGARVFLVGTLLPLLACTSYYAGVKQPMNDAQLLQIAYRQPPLDITAVNGTPYGYTLNWAFFTNPGPNDLEVSFSIGATMRSKIVSVRPLALRADGAAGTAVVLCDLTAYDMRSYRLHYYALPFQLPNEHEGKRMLDAICEVYGWVSQGRNLDVRRALKWGVPLTLRRGDGVTLSDHIRQEAKAGKNPDLLELLQQ